MYSFIIEKEKKKLKAVSMIEKKRRQLKEE